MATKRFHVPKEWTFQQRLDHFTARTDNPADCWPWTGYKDAEGYALLWWDGRLRRAARAMCIERGDVMTRKMVAMHHCDNPPCMNPTHVEAASNSKNQLDCNAKGRRKYPRGKDSWLWGRPSDMAGEKHPGAKLTWEIVRYIRSGKMKETQQQLADKLGVSQRLISLASSGKTWPERYDPQSPANISSDQTDGHDPAAASK